MMKKTPKKRHRSIDQSAKVWTLLNWEVGQKQ